MDVLSLREQSLSLPAFCLGWEGLSLDPLWEFEDPTLRQL